MSVKLKKILAKIPQAISYSKKNRKSDWGNLVLFFITISSSIFGLAPIIWKFAPFIWLKVSLILVLFILAVIGWVQTNAFKFNMKESEKELIVAENNIEILESNMQSIPENIIKYLVRYWDLDYDERITIYRDVEDGFIPVGRDSKNPELKKINRKKYPKNIGYISIAWHQGCYTKVELPDPEKDEKNYLDTVKCESKMNKKMLKEISMYSRSYFCRNLPYDNPVAMIVIESRKPNLTVQEQQLKKDLEDIFEGILLSTIKPNLPIGEDSNEQN